MKTLPSRQQVALLLITIVLLGCGPSSEEQAEQRRIECLDKFCSGDKDPRTNLIDDALLKVNGQFLIGPRTYFSQGRGGAVFYWPSREPGFLSGGTAARFKDFNEVGIEVFITGLSPQWTSPSQLIVLAEKNDWIKQRRTVRKGLDQIEMHHVIGPDGQYFDHFSYFVATELKGLDGLPPVAGCTNNKAFGDYGRGNTGFIWQHGIGVGVRINNYQHCADWPELYQEVIHVLSLLRKG